MIYIKKSVSTLGGKASIAKLYTAGAAKPDSGEPNNVSCWRSAGGEATSVSWCRSTRRPGRMAGKRMAGKKSLDIIFREFHSAKIIDNMRKTV